VVRLGDEVEIVVGRIWWRRYIWVFYFAELELEEGCMDDVDGLIDNTVSQSKDLDSFLNRVLSSPV